MTIVKSTQAMPLDLLCVLGLHLCSTSNSFFLSDEGSQGEIRAIAETSLTLCHPGLSHF